MSPMTRRTAIILVSVLLIFAFGCSKARRTGSTIFNSETGKHPDNWIVDHRAAYLSDTGQCVACHGADLKGGVSGVSCFSASWNGYSCHANGPSGHASGWNDPGNHGVSAKAAPDALQGKGFQACERCHGTDFAGGVINRSCFTCHGVSAPHSPRPWKGGARTHTDVNSGNAPVCAQCHVHGAYSSTQPNPPAATGTAPGCFNSTLCHGQVGHAVGWSSADVHGLSAKAAPGSASGFAYCQTCHGTDFAGGSVSISCFTCHTVSAPHSPRPWRGGVRKHTDTNTQNAAICVPCHANGANSTRQPVSPAASGTAAGCFNNTLCHGTDVAAHPLPFIASSAHGTVAKADLTYCEQCHANPAGGAGSNPRFNFPQGNLATGCEAAGCHLLNTAHPKPWSANNAYATSHQSAGNMANACALCHGATMNGGSGPACSTCHTGGSPLVLTNCASCHASPPSGASAPNRAGSHAKHMAITNVTCGACHSNAGSGTAQHMNTTVDVAISATYSILGAASFNASAHTCSNVSCHADAYGPGSATTPSWGTASGCGSCHGNSASGAPSTGSHTTHVGITTCGNCHTGAVSGVSGGSAHLDGNIDVIGGYPANIAKHTAGTYSGACANIYCHSNGTSVIAGTIPANNSPTWGGSINCGSCHGIVGDDGRPNYANNTPKRNTHGDGVSYGTTHKATACPTCHTGVSGSAGAYTVNPAIHNNGVYDLQGSLGYTQGTGGCATPVCHSSAVWGGTLRCIDCHNAIQNAPNASLASGGTVTNRDAVVGEFGLAWGHKKTGRGAVADADCIVCHLEGNFSTQKISGMHGDGYINLRNPDGAGETSITNISAATYSFVSFSTSYAAGARTSSGHTANTVDNILTQKFCLACHDSNGATNTTARSNNGGTGTATMPFGGIALGANYTAANNAIGTQGLIDVKSQLTLTNSSVHPVLGSITRDFPYSTRMAVPYNNIGTARDSNGTSGHTTASSVVLNCFDCHNTPTPLTNRTVAAHGNAQTLRGTIYASAAASTLCTTCHTGYTAAPGSATNHGTGSAWAVTGSSHDVRSNCHYCHGSNTGTARAVRPLGAQDYHGNNALVGGGLWPTINSRPYAFIRGWTGGAYHRPYRALEFATGSATCGTGNCPMGGGNQVANGNTTAYTPGGSY